MQRCKTGAEESNAVSYGADFFYSFT